MRDMVVVRGGRGGGGGWVMMGGGGGYVMYLCSLWNWNCGNVGGIRGGIWEYESMRVLII